MKTGVCLLIAASLFPATAPAKSPPSQFAIVNGARLEFLDWGGNGPPIVFLGGLGASAHIFDDFAPMFKATHHCFGFTRRGFGRSEQTSEGYELDNLTQDVIAFVLERGFQDVTLVGHSYGGREAVRAAELRPDLVERVVLLDTAYDSIPPGAPAAEEKLFAALTRMTPKERLSSVNSCRTYQKRLMRSWSAAAEADLHETNVINPDGTLRDRTPSRIYDAILNANARTTWKTTKIPSRALLLFADNPWSDLVSGLDLDPETASQIKAAGAAMQAARQAQIDAFRRDAPLAKIVILEHTVHQCFIQRRARVAQEMRRFFADYPISSQHQAFASRSTPSGMR